MVTMNAARPADWRPQHRHPRALISGPLAALAVVLAWLAILGSGIAAGAEGHSVTVGLMTGAAVLFALLGCSVVVLGFAALIRGGRD